MSRQTRVERLGQIFAQIVDVLDADRDAHQVVGDADRLPPLGRHRRVRHRRGMADERLHAAEALGQRHQRERCSSSVRAFSSDAELERDQPAKAAHLPAAPARAAGVTAGRDSARGSPSGARRGTRPAPARWRCAAPSGSAASWCRAAPATRPSARESRPRRSARTAATRCGRRAPRRRRRRRCRCGRSGTSSCCAPRGRRRTRSAAARTGWRTCCPRPRRRRARAPIVARRRAGPSAAASGLVGVSRNSIFVAGRIAARSRRAFDVST